MTDLIVVVPRRSDGGWRDRLWRYVNAHWAGWPVREGHDFSDGPLNRAAARNQGAQGHWGIAVFADADTVVDHDRLRGAVELARETGKLVCPQHEFHSLSREATHQVLEGAIDPRDADVRWVYRRPKSSCIVVPRPLWDEVGGYDEQFIGWGFEDAAFYSACQALSGVERLRGACWHLWHPRSPEKDSTSPNYRANRARAELYKQARTPEAMRELLEQLPVAA